MTMTTITSQARTAVIDNLSASRFEAYADGQLVGYITYSIRGSEIWMLRTVIEYVDRPRLKRRIESLLVDAALRSIHARRMGLLPFCPVVREHLRGQPAFLSLLPAAERQKYMAPRAKGGASKAKTPTVVPVRTTRAA